MGIEERLPTLSDLLRQDGITEVIRVDGLFVAYVKDGVRVPIDPPLHGWQ